MGSKRGLKFNADKRKAIVLNEEERLKCEVRVESVRLNRCAIRSLVNTRDMQLECARVFHETLLVPVFMYGSGKDFKGLF